MIKTILFLLRAGNLLVIIALCNTYLSKAIASNKICFTGRIVESIGSYGESVHCAAELALEENNTLKNEIQLRYYFYDNKPLQPIYIYHKMIEDDCSAIIGFEYLSDLLLVIKEQKTENIPIFTSYASFLSMEKVPNNVFVFMPSYDKHATKMIEFLKEKFGTVSKILLITEVNREEMLKYNKAYSAVLEKKNIKFSSYNFLANDSLFLSKLKKHIKNKKYRFVILLSGTTASAKIVDFLKASDIVYVGTETFGSTASPTFYTRISNKNIKAYFIRNLDYIKDQKLLTFKTKYSLAFKKIPTVLSAYTYDAVNIIMQSFKESRSIDAANIYKLKYQGITGAFIRNQKFYRSRKLTILSVHPDGYHYEK